MTNRGHPAAVNVLRRQQETDSVLGPLFKALHTFLDRTRTEFFSDVDGNKDLPYPVISMEKDRGKRMGFYTVVDGYLNLNRINLNPYALRTGVDAAETLAHEFVHLWQFHVGRPCRNNYHSLEFHEMMLEYGIITEGRGGYHADYTDDKRWVKWVLEENSDLELDGFILPGMDAKEPRKMLKLQCPDCGSSFRNRRVLNVQCLDCDKPFVQVVTRKTSGAGAA